MASSQNQPHAIAASHHPRYSVRGAMMGIRILLARTRFLAVFAVVFAIVGGWETIRSRVTRLIGTTPPEMGISADAEYFCPMDPGIISDWPSKCPVCNMSLVLRKRGELTPLPEGVVARMQVTPYRLWLGGVSTSSVEFEPLVRTLKLPGVVIAKPGGAPHIEAAVFSHELSWIEPGQKAVVVLERDGADLSLDGKVQSPPSPAAGEKSAASLIIDVPPRSKGLDDGDSVQVILRCAVEKLEPFRDLPSRPPKILQGEPRRVYTCMAHPDVVRDVPGSCPKDRSVLMPRSLRDNQRLRWWCPMHPEITSDRGGAKCDACGGMLLVPRVISYRLPGSVLGVPSSAVIDDGIKSMVYVEMGPGMFDARLVKLGPRCDGAFPVVSGLEPGDRVVTQGAFLLDAETRLNPSLAAGYFGAGSTAASGHQTQGSQASHDLSLPEWLEGLAQEDRPRAIRQKNCPVTGKALGTMGVPVKVGVKGIEVFLCCDGCSSAIEAKPEKYLSKLPKGDKEAGR